MESPGELKGFGRRPVARRSGEPPGAGVGKPRKEETAGRSATLWGFEGGGLGASAEDEA